MFKRLFYWAFPDFDREAELNAEISRMSAFVSKNYTPKEQVLFLEGVRDNILADLERTKAVSMQTYKDCDDAIRNIKTTPAKKLKAVKKEDPNQTKLI